MTKYCVSNNHLVPAESTASNKKSRSIRVICPRNRSKSALLRTEKGLKEVKTMWWKMGEGFSWASDMKMESRRRACLWKAHLYPQAAEWRGKLVGTSPQSTGTGSWKHQHPSLVQHWIFLWNARLVTGMSWKAYERSKNSRSLVPTWWLLPQTGQ